MAWFHRKAQPKEDHPSVYQCLQEDTQTLSMHLSDYDEWNIPRGFKGHIPSFFSSTDTLWGMPASFTPPEMMTLIAFSATREFIRRRLANGAKLGDRSEMFCFETIGEIAEKMGVSTEPKEDHPSIEPLNDANLSALCERFLSLSSNDCTLAELAEALQIKLTGSKDSRNPLLNRPPNPKLDIKLIY